MICDIGFDYRNIYCNPIRQHCFESKLNKYLIIYVIKQTVETNSKFKCYYLII